MSQHKPIKSIPVDELLNQIKQMTGGSECSVYKKLSCYDKILKKHNIDSLNVIALQIYQYLLEQQTLTTLPARSRSKLKPFKFSQSEIHLSYSDQQSSSSSSGKQQHHHNNNNNNNKNNEIIIQDPQNQNENLFSFAKNNNKYEYNNKRYINNDQIQPRQLFTEKNSSKFKSKSTKTLLGKQYSNSENNLINKTISHNSISNNKQKINITQQQQLLLQYLRFKHNRQFLSLLQTDKQQTHYQTINKRVKYIYCMKLFTKSFQCLKNHCEISISQNKKVSDFRLVKDESILEEVFCEWRGLTEMSQYWKQRIQMIDDNFKQLCSFLFINRLKLTAHIAKVDRRRKELVKQELQSNVQILMKRIFYRSLAFKFQLQSDTIEKSAQLHTLLFRNRQHHFTTNLKHHLQHQQHTQSHSIHIITTRIFGKRLLTNLLNEQNFMQVYWRRPKQSQKIIFMNYLLHAMKSRFKRLGYQYPWMRMLQKNMQSRDCKLNGVLCKHQKQQIFNRLALNYQQEKQKREKVKSILMDRFLKRLTYSHYLKFKKQSQTIKQNDLVNFLCVKHGQKLLYKVMRVKEKEVEIKYAHLRRMLFHTKSSEFFIYLEAYKTTKHHYTELLHSFYLKRQMSFLSIVWIGFKRTLKEEIINKKLVKQYIKLKNKLIVENCFEQLKNNTFEEKLFRKKEKNLVKLVKLRAFDQLTKRLTDNLKYQPYQKLQLEHKFVQTLHKRRKLHFLSRLQNQFHQSHLSNLISSQLSQNYQTHLITKCFEIMKFVTLKSKQQQQIIEQFKKMVVMKRKQITFDKMLKMTVKRHSIRLFWKITDKIISMKIQQNLSAVFELFVENKNSNKRKVNK